MLPDHMASFLSIKRKIDSTYSQAIRGNVQNEKQKYRKGLSNAYLLIYMQAWVHTHKVNNYLLNTKSEYT